MFDAKGALFRLEAGVHEIYWAGRSQGLGIDRVVLHLADKAERAYALNAPPTPPQSAAQAMAPATAGGVHALHAERDFSLEVPGFAPFYRDFPAGAPERHALAIDARVPQHRNAFAAAEAKFNGPTGYHDLVLATLTKNDGESTTGFAPAEK